MNLAMILVVKAITIRRVWLKSTDRGKSAGGSGRSGMRFPRSCCKCGGNGTTASSTS